MIKLRSRATLRSVVFMAALLFTATVAFTQNPPFWNEIQAFRKSDSVQMPAKKQILFVGSSSFTMWKDVQDYFPGYPILNRGFGGSSLPDLIRYADDVILNYDPKQVVIYCGENDLAASDTVQAATVLQRFTTLFQIIRAKYPRVPVMFISIKPSPSRAHRMPEMVKANLAIRNFLKKKKRTVFVDVYHAMLNEQSKPMPDIFLNDNLHMNAKGYAIWQEKIKPHLINK